MSSAWSRGHSLIKIGVVDGEETFGIVVDDGQADDDHNVVVDAAHVGVDP